MTETAKSQTYYFQQWYSLFCSAGNINMEAFQNFWLTSKPADVQSELIPC